MRHHRRLIPDRSRAERGTALIMTMVVAVLMVSLSMALAKLAQHSGIESQQTYDDFQLFIAAESGLAVAEKDVNQRTANFQNATDIAATFPRTLRIGGDQGATVTLNAVHLDNLDHHMEDDDGIVSQVQIWRITADALKTAAHGGTRFQTTKRVNRLVYVTKTPLFQFVVFYENDLEICNGPPMTLTGRVHTNQDIWLSPENQLTMNSNYVRSVGNAHRRRKDQGRASGNVDVQVYEQPGTYQSWDIGFDSYYTGTDANGDGDYLDPGDDPNWTVGATQAWQGTVRTSVHDANVWESPEVQNTAPFVPQSGGDFIEDPSNPGKYIPAGAPGAGTHSKGFYHETADLVILQEGASDNYYACWRNPASGTTMNVTADLTASGILDTQEIFDGREEKTVPLTKLDMKLLSESSYWPDNGLVYTHRDDMTRQSEVGGNYNPSGVLLTNGEQLRDGMTLVTDGPAFLHGDFNTGLTQAEMAPDYTGETGKQGAAVICDAANYLSNSWDHSKQNGQLPAASDTTFNCAMVTGNSETTFSDGSRVDYNGGFENLPRFHENWGGRDCVIRGSFVCLWYSSVQVGRWIYGSDNYRAPGRDWDFDQDFFDADNLPPFTPMAVGTSRSVQWEE